MSPGIEAPDKEVPTHSSEAPDETEWIIHSLVRSEGVIREGYFSHYQHAIAYAISEKEMKLVMAVIFTKEVKNARVYESFDDAQAEIENIMEYDRSAEKAPDISILSLTPIKYSEGRDK